MQYSFRKIACEKEVIILEYASVLVGYQKNRMGVIMRPTDVARHMLCHLQLPVLGLRSFEKQTLATSDTSFEN